MNLFEFNQRATKGALGKGEPLRPFDPRNPKPIAGPFQNQIQTFNRNRDSLNLRMRIGVEGMAAMEQGQREAEQRKRGQDRRIGNPVGGYTNVGIAAGPGQEIQSVGQWSFRGFGDRDEDVGEFGSVRDESGQRFNEDRGGNMVNVGNRINAQVGGSSPTQGNRGGMGGGLNWLNQRSPLAQMGREMSPAQSLLNEPMNSDDYDPFDTEQTMLNEQAWNRRNRL
jgi:hypothetical protein